MVALSASKPPGDVASSASGDVLRPHPTTCPRSRSAATSATAIWELSTSCTPKWIRVYGDEDNRDLQGALPGTTATCPTH